MENTTSHPNRRYRNEWSALLTVNGVAQTLAVSRGMIYNLVRRGELEGVRVGERLRFRHADVEAYIERNSSP